MSLICKCVIVKQLELDYSLKYGPAARIVTSILKEGVSLEEQLEKPDIFDQQIET